MRAQKAAQKATLAAVALAAGLSLTACQGGQDSGKGEDSKASSASSSTEQGAQEKTQDSAGKKLKTAAAGSRADAVNPAAGAASKRCHTDDLKFTWGGPHGGRPDMNAENQQAVSIRLTNKANRTCTLHGFPGVRLISESGEKWDLRRSSVTPTTRTLKPGDDTAMIDMTILPVPKDIKDTKPFIPSKVMITPPNETKSVTFKWPYGGAILDQSAATRPGTFVNPIGVG
ncbi:DUF4232 domain-containing protein [Streptomyces sp. ODS28]|uniref:DUF4232 domain-containing protein n=1 Tax=Streptomyces sp. ODS28 TaxID=3136688 RepID=UPI0031E64B62